MVDIADRCHQAEQKVFKDVKNECITEDDAINSNTLTLSAGEYIQNEVENVLKLETE